MALYQPCPNDRATAAQHIDAARAATAQGWANAKDTARAAIAAARTARLNAIALGELPTLP